MASQCPYLAMQQKAMATPQGLDLSILSQAKHFGADASDYPKRFQALNFDELRKDVKTMLKDSKSWWPADWGHYGPLMVRLAWHSAGTYRASDGRGGANGGNIRFFPHYTWPDNGNLDKARRLLWPVKQKYGKNISWADLIVFVGNVAMEDMGFKTFGFGGGRIDIWGTEKDAYWGEDQSFQGLAKDPKKLENPLGAAQMRLIYVNPEGPDAIPDPALAAPHIRETFGRMSMNDEETVALIAGGHTFGKAHGAAPGSNQGPEPDLANTEEQGFGWTVGAGKGVGKDAITSGLEGSWTKNPTTWDPASYFDVLYKYEWELFKSPAGAQQWRPKGGAGDGTVPDAHESGKTTHPIMFTTDLALITDPAYKAISDRFHKNPAELADAFARAWYKLTHRDMGPVTRLVGPEVAPAQIWQDPVPKGVTLSANDVFILKGKIRSSGLSSQQLVSTAWASACTYRGTDFRGGTNGARIRLAPQKDWEVNEPTALAAVLAKYEEIKKEFGQVSIADLIVLGGNVGVENAAPAGLDVPFVSGRGDASAEETDAASFAVLEPKSDAFRNFKANPYQMVDRAHLLGLTAPEMSVLVAGLRTLDINCMAFRPLGCLTADPGRLSNDFFVNLLDMDTMWKKTETPNMYQGVDRKSGEMRWSASSVDLAFGSNPDLRAIAEHYACSDSKDAFVNDFASAWAKVMGNGVF